MPTYTARFDTLGELLRDIAIRAGLRFRVVQIDGALVFQVLPIVDRSADVRLDLSNRQLTAQKVALTAPDTTRVIVAGQGEGELRTLLERSTTDSQTAETEWGRRIEEFKDQRQTNDTAQLEAAGDQRLQEAVPAVSVAAIPADETTMLLGVDWNVGDVVGAVVEGQEVAATVTEATIVAGSRGVKVGMTLGDSLGFDASRALRMQVKQAENRVSYLERTISPGTYDTAGTAATLIAALDYTDVGAAAASHTHAASDVTSGTLDVARLPTGTSGTTVALGNHTHTAADVGAVAGSVRLTVATSSPGSPATNDVWIDTTSTPVVKVYNGSTWV